MSIAHRVEKVPHGFDVAVAIRSIDRHEELTKSQALLLAWMSIGQSLEAAGVNLYDAMITAPEALSNNDEGADG